MRYAGEDIGISSKIGSAITYLTGGLFGFVALIVMYFSKKQASRFFTFNTFQAIIISFIVFIIAMGWGIIYKLLSPIPFIQLLVSWVDFLFNKPILFYRSVSEWFVGAVTLYCTIFSLLGKYPVIYKISDLIKR